MWEGGRVSIRGGLPLGGSILGLEHFSSQGFTHRLPTDTKCHIFPLIAVPLGEVASSCPTWPSKGGSRRSSDFSKVCTAGASSKHPSSLCQNHLLPGSLALLSAALRVTAILFWCGDLEQQVCRLEGSRRSRLQQARRGLMQPGKRLPGSPPFLQC